VREARAIVDIGRMLGTLGAARIRRRVSKRDATVIVVPGFNTDDRVTAPLRSFLAHNGYTAEGWGLGRNLAGLNLSYGLADVPDSWRPAEARDDLRKAAVAYLCKRFGDLVARRAAETGRPAALIGWSMGGYIAREVARDLPDVVAHVITLGAPVIGGPKYTLSAPYFASRGIDPDWIEQEVARRDEVPIRCQVTAIYSKSDAVVAWEATIDRVSPNVQHVEVDAAHLGLVFNPGVWRHIIAALDGGPLKDDAPGQPVRGSSF
jgi:pimeloyl-ACP methyl ester carboxylesterase